MVHLESLGVMGSNTTITHATQIDDAEAEAFARTGTNIAYCPLASLKGAFGVTAHGRYHTMRQAGVNIAFATDGYDPEILQAARIGLGTFKDLASDEGSINALNALEAITVNAAQALGLSDEIGSIEVGKEADIVCFDTRNVQWRPLMSPVDQLIYSADGRSIDSVWVAGQQRIAGGRAVGVDEAALIDQVQGAAQAILERSGLPPLKRSYAIKPA